MHLENRLLPISALQHLLFCPRQCALIHIERAWADNRLTVEGGQFHERVHAGASEVRDGVRITCAVPLRSVKLGLFGVADVIEFHSSSDTADRLTPVPVEYKRGKPKKNDCDRVQLCAQAICLEDTLGVVVPSGALFYGKTRRREKVDFERELRKRTEEAAANLHELLRRGVVPGAKKQAKCKRCSFKDICLPEAFSIRSGASGYVAQQLRAAERSIEEDVEAF